MISPSRWFSKTSLYVVLFLSAFCLTARADTAVITFSSLFDGTVAANGAKAQQRPLTQSYQPLMQVSPDGKPADGGNLQVTITWDNAATSNPCANHLVSDHTGDNSGTDKEIAGGVLFGGAPFTMTFDKPVKIPSFFWTFYSGAGGTQEKGTVTVYTNATDTTPAKSIDITYGDAVGYIWREEKGLADLPITKIVFDPGGKALNIDDITVQTAEAATSTPSTPAPSKP